MVWLLLNAWASMPVHEDTLNSLVFMWVVFLVNPMAFATCALVGWRKKSLSVAILWPAMIFVSWLVVPALGGAWTWGLEVIPRLLFRRHSTGFFFYVLLCLSAYFAALIGARMRYGKHGEFRGHP